MIVLKKLGLGFILLALLAGCTTAPAPDTGPALGPPQSGKTHLVGRLLSKSSGQPLASIVVRLADTTREGDRGMFVLDIGRSPGAVTDPDGYFAFENIDPLEYVVIVQKTEGLYDPIQDAEGKPRTWTTTAGQPLDIGEVVTDFVP